MHAHSFQNTKRNFKISRLFVYHSRHDCFTLIALMMSGFDLVFDNAAQKGGDFKPDWLFKPNAAVIRDANIAN